MGQRTALVIDDEPDITSYLETLLSDNGWNVIAANSADEGLALFQKNRPDVVILDIMMPDRGGLSTLVAIRKDPELSATPVIFLTGIQEHVPSDFELFLNKVKQHRADAFLEKPIDAQRLLGTMDELTTAS
jgi:CheY-like chemotaxis protein